MYCSIFNSHLHFIVEIVQSVGVSDTELTQLDVALLLRIDIVPNFGYVFASERDPHSFNGRNEVRFLDFALASLVHETEDLSLVSVLVFHPRQDHTCQLLHIIKFGRC